MKAKLTLQGVEAAKPKARPYEIRDTDLTGLLLRIQPSGIKSFYVELGRSIRVRLGRYPVMTVAGARLQAKARLGDFAKTGIVPAKTKVVLLEDFLAKPEGKDFQLVDVKIASSSDPTLGEGIGVGIAQENTELKARIDKALCELVADGSIGKASQTWFKTDISRPCK